MSRKPKECEMSVHFKDRRSLISQKVKQPSPDPSEAQKSPIPGWVTIYLPDGWWALKAGYQYIGHYLERIPNSSTTVSDRLTQNINITLLFVMDGI